MSLEFSDVLRVVDSFAENLGQVRRKWGEGGRKSGVETLVEEDQVDKSIVQDNWDSAYDNFDKQLPHILNAIGFCRWLNINNKIIKFQGTFDKIDNIIRKINLQNASSVEENIQA